MEPVAVDTGGRPGAAVHREHDLPAVRLVARGRVLLATLAVMTGSLLPAPDSRRDVLLYVLGLFWVPWSGWLALGADVYDPRFTRTAGAVGDLVVVATLGFVEGSLLGVAVGCGIVVLVGAYTGPVRGGVRLSIASVAIFVAVSVVSPPSGGPRWILVALYASVLIALLVVLARGSNQNRRASLRSERFQNRSAAVLERVADGVVVTDPLGTVVEANPAAERIMGVAAHGAPGRHCHDVLALRMGERPLDCSLGCALLRLDGGRDDADGKEVWRTTPGGGRQPLLANVCAITGEDGRVEEVVHSLRDITTLKQADEAKTLFLATASHELKTPLTVIRGFAEMLLDTPALEGQARRAADTIVRRCEELSTIVDGLLLSSRIEAGRLELGVTPIDVAGILRERGGSLTAATGRTVDIVVPTGLPEVDADPAAVTTVVDHLLDNAIKYSPGGGAIVLEAEAFADEVHVRVADAGIGMDPQQAARCFEKFWQAESSDLRRFKGSGIGLYIVRSLVEALGGTIAVRSVQGVGTTFTVALHRAGRAPSSPEPGEELREGKDSIVREFMRQLGIPAGNP